MMSKEDLPFSPFYDAAISALGSKAVHDFNERGRTKFSEKYSLSNDGKTSSVYSLLSSVLEKEEKSVLDFIPTTSDILFYLEETYEKECLEIQRKYREDVKASSQCDLPYFYPRNISPISDELSRLLSQATKSVELEMRKSDALKLADLENALVHATLFTPQAKMDVEDFMTVATRTYESVHNLRTIEDIVEEIDGVVLCKTENIEEGKEVVVPVVPFSSPAPLSLLPPLTVENSSILFSASGGSDTTSKLPLESTLHETNSLSSSSPSTDEELRDNEKNEKRKLNAFSPWLTPLAYEGEEEASGDDENDNSHIPKGIEREVKSKVPEKSGKCSSGLPSLSPEVEEQAGGGHGAHSASTSETNSTSGVPMVDFGNTSLYRCLMDKKKFKIPENVCGLNSMLTLFISSLGSSDQFLYPPQLLERCLNPIFVDSVSPFPRISMSLFFTALQNVGNLERLKRSDLLTQFQYDVELWRTEGQLMLIYCNTDGRLAENEFENYVKGIIPKMSFKGGISDSMLPFYCCTISRKLFWELDKTSRGTVPIEAVLESNVLKQLLRMKVRKEDEATSWLGSATTQQLYDKFINLDTRGRGTLQADDLKRYKKGLPTVAEDGLVAGTSPLSSLFVDRYFETTVLMVNNEMDFRKFVDFVIAVEVLPECTRPLFFWNILDLYHTGVLTPMIVNSFFRETQAKVAAVIPETASRDVVIPELFDLLSPAQPLQITREEFLQSPQAGLFTSIVIDCLAFWLYENRPGK